LFKNQRVIKYLRKSWEKILLILTFICKLAAVKETKMKERLLGLTS